MASELAAVPDDTANTRTRVSKNSPNTASSRSDQLIRAVGQRHALVGGGDGLEDFAADGGGVVGFEVAHGRLF